MKKILSLFTMLTLFVSMMAQTPFNYQAVLRDINTDNNQYELVRNQSGNVTVTVANQMTVTPDTLLKNFAFSTNSDGMVNLPLVAREGINWKGAVITAVFTYGEKTLTLNTPVTPVPYAYHADNAILTTESIEDYLASGVDGYHAALLHAALKSNSEFHDACRDTVVEYIKANYPKAKEIAYDYLRQVTSTDVNQFYNEARGLSQEVKDSLYSVAKRFLKENRDLVKEMALYYAGSATSAEVQQLYNELQANATASAKVRSLLNGYFDAYLIRMGLYCDHATLCEIINQLEPNPNPQPQPQPTVDCPTLGTTTLEALTPNGIIVTAPINNYNANIVESSCGCYLESTTNPTFGTDVKTEPNYATISIIEENGNYTLRCLLNPIVYADFGVNDFTITPYLIENSNVCDDSIPGTLLTITQCARVHETTCTIDNNGLLKLTAYVDYNNSVMNMYFRIEIGDNNSMVFGDGVNGTTVYNSETGEMSYTLTADQMEYFSAGQSIGVRAVLAVDLDICGREEVESTPTTFMFPSLDEPCATENDFTASAVINSDGLIATLTCHNNDFEWTNRILTAKAYAENDNTGVDMNVDNSTNTGDSREASINPEVLTTFNPMTVIFTVSANGENCEARDFEANVVVCPQFGEPHVTSTMETLTYTIPFSPVTTTFTQGDVTITIHQNNEPDIVEEFTSFSLDNTNGVITLTASVRDGVDYSNASYDVNVAMSNDCTGSMTNSSYSELCPSLGESTVNFSNVSGYRHLTVTTPITNNYDLTLTDYGYNVSVLDQNNDLVQAFLFSHLGSNADGVTLSLNSQGNAMSLDVNTQNLTSEQMNAIWNGYDTPGYHIEIIPYVAVPSVICGPYGRVFASPMEFHKQQ